MTAGHGPGIGRDQARELARRELARSIYRPSLPYRLWHDVLNWLSSPGGLGSWGVLALAIVVLAAIGVTAALVGSARRSRRIPGQPLLGDRPRSADDYRAAAERLAAAGDYGSAIAERVRAIAADLEARATLPPGPARTAIELAAAAGRVYPAAAAELTAAAHLFDEVRYGGRPGSERGYLRVSELDNSLRAAAARSVSRRTVAAAGPFSAGSSP
jgi:hypothetical protein